MPIKKNPATAAQRCEARRPPVEVDGQERRDERGRRSTDTSGVGYLLHASHGDVRGHSESPRAMLGATGNRVQ